MGFDLRNAPVVAKSGTPSPIIFDAAHHAAHTSPDVDAQASARPSPLCPLDFVVGDAPHRVHEVDPRRKASKGNKNGGHVDVQSIQDRVGSASKAFAALNGTGTEPLKLQLSDDAIVFLVSHGKTTVEWFNALQIATRGPRLPRKDLFDGSPSYTGFAELTFVAKPDGSGAGVYVPSSAPFQTPHLKALTHV